MQGMEICRSSVSASVCTFGAVGLLVFAFRDYNAGGGCIYARCSFGGAPHDRIFVDGVASCKNCPCGNSYDVVLYSSSSFVSANGARGIFAGLAYTSCNFGFVYCS